MFIFSNELAGAAMRFGHSTIDGFYSVVRDDGHPEPLWNLGETFHNQSGLYERGESLQLNYVVRVLLAPRNSPSRID